MIELVGYGDVTFYALQVSEDRIMTFVPYGVEVPGSVVSAVHLRRAYYGVPSFEWLHTIDGFTVESWLIR